MNFLVIGDSHSLFFDVHGTSGRMPFAKFTSEDWRRFPEVANFNFEVHYLGPVLAKSLTEKQSTLMARKQILDILESTKIKNVLFSFGEIDCRFHVVERLNKGRDLSLEQTIDSIRVTVCRYASFLFEVKSMGFNVFTWGPIATNQHTVDYPGYPNYGNIQTRNHRYLAFYKELCRICEGHIKNLTVFDKLIDENFESKREYYGDEVHITKEAWKFILPIFQEIKHATNL
jgi:hypothetical protein